jgi:hypothetical protein
VVAAREFGKRSTLRPSPSGLGVLRRRQFRRTAHALPELLCPAAALGGAGADWIALHVRQSAQHGNHKPPGAGAGVGPRLGQRTELRLGIHDLLDDSAAREAVNACDRHHIAGRKALEQFEKLAPVVRAPVTFSR